jgi:hypothetical protein
MNRDEIVLAVSNLYHIIYTLPSRKSLKNKLQELMTENIHYNTIVYDNTITLVKILISLELDFDKNK